LSPVLHFLLRHPYPVLFGIVLSEQLGIPLPSVPVLLAAGALAGTGDVRLGSALAVAVIATLLADHVWFEAGRRRGAQVLNLLCRISLEPDSCVRRTENVFARHGPRSLLYVKFVPGLGIVGVALAGAFGLRRARFLLWDGAGALVWAGAYMTVGYAFSTELEKATRAVLSLGTAAIVLFAGLLAAYVGAKFVQRQRFLHQIRIDRITAEELERKLTAGEPIAIVDLRHRVDFDADPRTLPGAIRLGADELDVRHGEIPRDRDVVLYCT
jgi:membrane protein DedA with SNARE-associated domain